VFQSKVLSEADSQIVQLMVSKCIQALEVSSDSDVLFSSTIHELSSGRFVCLCILYIVLLQLLIPCRTDNVHIAEPQATAFVELQSVSYLYQFRLTTRLARKDS
jgi:hypothetical protein